VLVMKVKLWHLFYEIYHVNVMLVRHIIDLLRHTIDTCVEVLLDD
jgi:hypothetical protein